MLKKLIKARHALMAGVVFALCASPVLAAELPTHAADLPVSAKPGVVDPSRESRRGYIPPSEDGFFVPPVVDRPLDADEGERLFVQSILLRGAIDRPQAGISLKEVRGLVEQMRFERQQLDDETVEGFTEDELAVGAQLLRELVDRSDRDSEEATEVIDELVSDIRFRMQARWLTIGHLQQIVDKVTNYYRSKGFILAQAYLPAQVVDDGEVVIQVMEGMISNIVVQGNNRYSEALIKEPFVADIGQPAYKRQIESGLLQLSDYPGLAVFGVFQPGEELGTADLLLNVRKERRHEADLQLDNYGSEYTGEYRLQLSYTNNNVSRAADSINLRLVQNIDPTNSTFGAIRYQRPLFGRANQIIIDVSHNEFQLGGELESLDADGFTDSVSLSLRRSFVRSRTENHYAMIRLSKKTAELTSSLKSVDKLAVASLEYGFDAFDFRFSGVNLGWIKYSQGLSGILGAMDAENANLSSRQGDSGYAGSEFKKVELRFDRLQTLTRNQSLLLSLYGQYSEDLLTASEQMPIGGPGSVRAYSISEYLMDTGYLASLEWIIRTPGLSDKPAFGSTWGQMLQWVIFVETAAGSLNDSEGDDVSEVSVSGAGIGARFKLKSFAAHFDAAQPMSDEVASNGENTQFFFRLNYDF